MAVAESIRLPDHLAARIVDLAAADVGTTLGSMSKFTHCIPRIRNVTALAEHLRAVRIREFDEMVIIDFTVVGALANFATTLPLSRDGITVLQPINHVEVMNVLLYDMITAQ